MDALLDLLRAATTNQARDQALQRLRAVPLSGETKQTALHVACTSEASTAELVKLLLKQDWIDVNAVDRYQWTPLHCAACHGPLLVVQALLEHKGVLVGVRNADGTTPLHYLARRREDEQLMVTLLEAFARLGADFNAANANGETPLHFACSHDTSRWVMPAIIRLGGDVNAKSRKGETPLHYASRYGLMDVAALLITHGARMEQGQHGSPLQVANPSHPDLVNMLSLASNKNFSLPPGAMALTASGGSGSASASGGSSNSSGGGSAGGGALAGGSGGVGLAAALPPKASPGRTTVVGMARLPAKQRRLRHVRSLSLRHAPCMGDTWTLRLAVEQDAVVFERAERSHTCNPHWELDGHRIAKQSHAEKATIVHVRVSCTCEGGSDDCGAERSVLALALALDELVYVGVELTEGHVRFPDSALVVELVDGYYCTAAVFDALVAAAALPTVTPAKTTTGDSYALAEFVSLIQTWQTFRNKKTEVHGLEGLIDASLLEHRQAMESRARMEAKALRCAELQVRREELREQLAAERERLQQVRAGVLRDCESLVAARAEQAELHTEVEVNAVRTCDQLGVEIASSRARVVALHTQMVRQLLVVYPLEIRPMGSAGAQAAISSMASTATMRRANFSMASLSSKVDLTAATVVETEQFEWLIGGLFLPNSNFVGCEQDEIATALGYVCHVVHVLAQWLCVPLRYEMTPMSSRSTICDNISPQASGSPKFPLYARGVDRTRFEYGVFLLNKNVEQLLNAQGLELARLQNTLPNLWRLVTLHEDHARLPPLHHEAK